MKIALCLSGHLRSYKQTYSSLELAILRKYKPDVFLWSWNTLGFDNTRGDALIKHSSVATKDVRDLYDPKAINLTPSRKWLAHHKLHPGVRNHNIIYGMFYSIYKCNELKQCYEKIHGFKYDVVIRARPDIEYSNQLSIKDGYDENIYLPSFGGYGGTNDSFAYGSSRLMDKYANAYHNIDGLCNSGVPFQGEGITAANLQIYKIDTKPSNIKYNLLRANGQRFSIAEDKFV